MSAKEASSPGLGLSDPRMEESVSEILRQGRPLRPRLNLRCLNRDVQQAGGESGAQGEGHKGATREPCGEPGSGEGLITAPRPQEAAKWAGTSNSQRWMEGPG